MDVEISAMTKMWISFFAIGLMVTAAFIVSFARAKTKGWIRLVLTIIAIVLLLIGILYAFISLV